MGRAGLAVHRPLPPARRGCLPADLHAAGAKDPVVWTCAALIDGKLCLFDTRLGLEIPGPARRSRGGHARRCAGRPRRARAARPARAVILSDQPRQLARQREQDRRSDRLQPGTIARPGWSCSRKTWPARTGRSSTATAAGERDRLPGPWASTRAVDFWELPAPRRAPLFNNPKFVEATLFSLLLSTPIASRWSMPGSSSCGASSRGDPGLRHVPLRREPDEMDKQTPMPAGAQQALDIYATYFLGLCQLEQGARRPGRVLLRGRRCDSCPSPAGASRITTCSAGAAQANLGRLYEAKGRRRPGHRLLHPVRPDLAAARQPRPRPRARLGATHRRRPSPARLPGPHRPDGGPCTAA